MNNDSKQTRVKMTTLAMLTAISCVLVFLTLPYPLFPAFKYDLADIPILIATFSFGPLAGIIVTALASFVQAFILGQDNWIGFVMHMFATGSCHIPVNLQQRFHQRMIIGIIMRGDLPELDDPQIVLVQHRGHARVDRLHRGTHRDADVHVQGDGVPIVAHHPGIPDGLS